MMAPLLEAAAEPCGAGHAALLDQAAALLDQTCVHLPDRRAQGVDPVARLRDLRSRLPARRGELDRALLAIFAELGDQHTQCYLPEPYGSSVAFLPFVVRDVCENGERRLVVVVSSAVDTVRRGDLLLSWNGLPAERALEEHMALQLCAHREARREKALQTLTFRPLAWLPPPAEETVLLDLAGPEGRRREARVAWQVASAAWLKEHLAPALGEEAAGGPVQAGRVETSHGTFGHLRVRSFEERPETLLAAVLAALEQMPAEGLILDLRGCEKGFIQTGEQLLQLFTPGKIEPLRFQFRVTPFIARLVQSCPALHDWHGAVDGAFRSGEEYSLPRPLTTPDEANRVGRRYFGPVVLLVDALTYSTAEMVAAGFQDHGIGPVLGAARRTGGGGGTPWSQSTIFKLSGDEAFRPLPGAPQLRVAVRRCLRVNARAGQTIEGVGVVPDSLHRPTRADRLDGDLDLMETAGRGLAEQVR